MAVQHLFAGRESVVEVEGLDLERETALDVFEREVSGCWVPGLDDVEEVAVGVGVEEGEGGGLAPSVDPVCAEIGDGVAFDGREGRRDWGAGEVDVVFDRGEEGENVFFELEADEFFGTHIAHCAWAGRVRFIPCVGDGLREKVDPATVGG